MFPRYCEQKSMMNLGKRWGLRYTIERHSDQFNVKHRGQEAVEDNV